MQYRMNCRLLATALGLIAAPLLLAVNTATWTQTTQEDFAEGQMSSVVTTDLGELKLSRSTKPLLADTPLLDIAYCIAQSADGTIHIGTGPHGTVLQYHDGKTAELFKAGDSTLVTSLAIDNKGQILAGLSGEHARLVRIDPASGKASDLFKADDVEMIWAICQLPDGAILLGTGPNSKLLEIGVDGKPRVLYQGKEGNVLCILPGDKDDIYIGTDPQGMVIRVDRKTAGWFIVYQAEEPEIVALTRDKAGRLYAAASSAVEPGAAEEPEEKKPARPEAGTELPLRREAPKQPEPPKVPEPNPGEPEPIPKTPDQPDPVKHMAIGAAESPDKQPPGNPPNAPNPGSHPTSMPTHPPTSGQVNLGQPGQAPSSSAVYRIDPAGFVTEIFRKPVTIHSMASSDGDLLIGTGAEGLVYQVRPDVQETVVLARTDSHQVSAMAVAPDGRLLLGLSNPGGLVEMGSGYAERGTYTSKVLDAEQIARFGKLQLQGTLAPGTTVSVATRSGNVRDPELGGWSKWSDEQPAAEFSAISSPSARFAQYRLTLQTKDSHNTPTIDEVKVNYLIPNMPPKIASLKIEPEQTEPDPTGKTTSPAIHHITWDASDPNKDRMVFSLYYRLGHRGEWVLLKDKIYENAYEWNTRQVADGRYQIKLVASDAPSNPPGEALTTTRFSDPIILDNTPPAIGDVKTAVVRGKLEVSLRVVDHTSTVAGVDYAIDSSDDWQAASSSDMLYDSPDETVKFTVSKLSAGPHQLTLRTRDSHGNTAYETLVVSIDQPEQKK